MDHTHGFDLSNSSPSQQLNTSSQSTPRHPPSQFATNFRSQFSQQQFQSQFHPNLNPNLNPNFIPFNPYGFQPHFNHLNIGGPYEANWNLSPNRGFGRGAAVEGVQSSSPVESMPFFFAAGSSSPASPMSAAPQTNADFSNQDWSDNSDAEEKKGGRMNWTEEENLKLISSWLHHSKDSIKGNSQRSENFWKNIVAEFNSNVTEDRRRKVPQCKTHWTKTNKLVAHFNGCWIRMMRRRGSGESNDQVMANAHAVKDEQKWAKRKENQVTATNKRLKNTASGAYTSSSNQESQEATSPSKEPQPEGHKQAKARLKGKEKRHSSDMTLESLKTEKMKLYHEATQVKAVAMAKAAEATERKANVDLLNKYLEMTAVDTTGFSDVQLQRHEIALNFLQRKLSDEK
ncbi:unnamed protein product [Urochloa humidicola]